MRQEGRGESKLDSHTRSVFCLLAAVALIGWSYVFLRSDWFLIQQVEAVGLKTIDQLEVTRIVFHALDQRHGWRPWDTRHSWFIDRHELVLELQRTLFAESVNVEAVSKNILRLSIKERQHRVVLIGQQGSRWVNINGLIENEPHPAESKDIAQRLSGQRPSRPDDPPIILSSLDLRSVSSTQEDVIPTQRVRNWIQLATDLSHSGINYRALEPKSSVTSTSIEVLLTKSPYSLFIEANDPSTLQAQLNAYHTFVQSSELSKGTYRLIDLRIPNRIYLRP